MRTFGRRVSRRRRSLERLRSGRGRGVLRPVSHAGKRLNRSWGSGSGASRRACFAFCGVPRKWSSSGREMQAAVQVRLARALCGVHECADGYVASERKEFRRSATRGIGDIHRRSRLGLGCLQHDRSVERDVGARRGAKDCDRKHGTLSQGLEQLQPLPGRQAALRRSRRSHRQTSGPAARTTRPGAPGKSADLRTAPPS